MPYLTILSIFRISNEEENQKEQNSDNRVKQKFNKFVSTGAQSVLDSVSTYSQGYDQVINNSSNQSIPQSIKQSGN